MGNDKIIDLVPVVRAGENADTNTASWAERENTESPETSGYENKYDEESFWDKAKKYAKTLGCDGIEKALQLYYALDNPELPTKIKVIIYGALGYFISPIDLIPDITPLVGFTDDMAAIAAAVVMAASFINTDVKAKAHAKLEDWFGEGGCDEE